MSNLKTVVYQRLEDIANAEKITRVELGALSRELLIYVPDTNDIDIVNRLLGVVTNMNRRGLILYFQHFLPWNVEKDAEGNFSRFGKKLEGDKKVAKRMALIEEWLKDESNTFWVWSDANINLKQKDLFAPIGRAINKALEGDEKTNTPALSPVEVVAAIFGSNLTLADMIAGLDKMKLAQEEALAQEQAALDAMAEAA
jgi:hypothetical protein